MQPLLSIIVPCYKCSDNLDNSVVPLLNSDKIEVILVEDHSEDGTLDKCKKLEKQYSQVKVIAQNKNVGQAQARNAGIAKAKGKYITFLDADDYVDENYLKAILANLDADIIVWGCTELHYDKNNKLVKKVTIIPNSTDPIALEKQTLLGYLWNKAYKVSIVKNIQIPNEHLIEDILFNIEAFKKAKDIKLIKQSLYNYQRKTTKSDSVTTAKLDDYWEQQYRRIKAMYEWTKNKDVLGAIYCRYALSAIWRNKQNMTKAEQKNWINKFYTLELSKKLIPEAKPEGRLAKTYTNMFKKHKISSLILLASLIDFVTNNFSGLLIKARQSR